MYISDGQNYIFKLIHEAVIISFANDIIMALNRAQLFGEKGAVDLFLNLTRWVSFKRKSAQIIK